MRFNIDNTSVAIANCHLESGQSKADEWVEQFGEVINKAFTNKEERRLYEWNNHKIKFFFGDLNFRINLWYHDVVEASTTSWSE